jgi:hypothetical protein
MGDSPDGDRLRRLRDHLTVLRIFARSRRGKVSGSLLRFSALSIPMRRASIRKSRPSAAPIRQQTVVQVHGERPFAITYVNPADDPGKK